MRFTTQQAGWIVGLCFTLPSAPPLPAGLRSPLTRVRTPGLAYGARMMKEREKLMAEPAKTLPKV